MWNLLHRAWAYVSTHPDVIGWAAFFGLSFAAIFDVLDPNGRIRTGIRHIKNRLSEHSAEKLRKRVAALEARRNTIASYLDSDKALYLTVLRIMLVILVAIGGGNATAQFKNLLGTGPVVLLSLFFYGLAILGGIQGLKTTELDSREKITETITKLDSEIADLRTKLQAITK